MSERPAIRTARSVEGSVAQQRGFAGRFSLARRLTLVGLVVLAAVPVLAYLAGNTFWLDIFTRLTILSIAAVSLNLILGFGGLVSFGHAAFLGLGAYAVGIPVHYSINGGFDAIASTNGLFHIALAVGVSAAYALVTGAISLRTRGVYFIMITMAFGQMVFYAAVSISAYGGDDGLTIYERSSLPFISLDNPLALFAWCYGSLLAALFVVHRIVNSRFGVVIRGAKGNEERIGALGFDAYRYRLLAYVISGVMCGYAGALLGNFTTFISPAMMDWTRSGELLFMVILGGAGAVAGPVVGASVFLLLEEVMSRFTIYWHLPFGILLIGCVLFVRGGISGLLGQPAGRRDD